MMVAFSGLVFSGRRGDAPLDLLFAQDLHRIVGKDVAQARPDGGARYQIPAKRLVL